MTKRDRGTYRDLAVARVIDVPLPEVSGVCLRRDGDGSLTLVAIGDRVALAAWARLPDEIGSGLDWQAGDLQGLTGASLSERDVQIEAVCCDGTGRLLLLHENPPRAELIDPATRRVIASLELVIPEPHRLAKAWVDAKGSRGEGAILLRDGHVLVAKEKDPPALIEFGPAGQRALGVTREAVLGPGEAWPVSEGEQTLVPLATWLPDHRLAEACEDFSDLEIGPDGHLYVLSDQSARIARLADLVAGREVASVEQAWTIDDIEGKAEGLTFTAGGQALVALDTRKARHNLILLEPPLAR